MEKQIVWRVQDEFGDGPYSSLGADSFEDAAGDAFRFTSRQPLPWKDKILRKTFNKSSKLEGMTFGFKDPEQYVRWFETAEIRQALHDTGFFLAKYEVDGPVWHGQTQSLFYPEKAKLIAVSACNDAANVISIETVKMLDDFDKPVKPRVAARFLERQKEGQLRTNFQPA